MVLAVSIGVPGEQGQRFSRAFTRFTEGVSDLSEPFAEIGADLRKRILPEQFKSEGRSRPPAWQALSAPYAKRKARAFPGRPILTATGAMRDGLTGKTPDTLNQVRKLSAVFGLKPSGPVFQRALAHQLGAGRMPRREIMRLSQQDKKRWTRIVQAYLVKRAQAAERAAGG